MILRLGMEMQVHTLGVVAVALGWLGGTGTVAKQGVCIVRERLYRSPYMGRLMYRLTLIVLGLYFVGGGLFAVGASTIAVGIMSFARPTLFSSLVWHVLLRDYVLKQYGYNRAAVASTPLPENGLTYKQLRRLMWVRLAIAVTVMEGTWIVTVLQVIPASRTSLPFLIAGMVFGLAPFVVLLTRTHMRPNSLSRHVEAASLIFHTWV